MLLKCLENSGLPGAVWMNASQCHAGRFLSQLLSLNGKSHDLLRSQELLIPHLIPGFPEWHVAFTLAAVHEDGAGKDEMRFPWQQRWVEGTWCQV